MLGPLHVSAPNTVSYLLKNKIFAITMILLYIIQFAEALRQDGYMPVAQPGRMPPFHPAPQPKQPQVTKPLGATNANNSALRYSNIDLSKGNNVDFVNIVDWRNPAFVEFLNSNKDISDLINQIVNSFSVTNLDTIGGNMTLSLPDPEVLKKQVENAVTFYTSARNYVRVILQKIEKFLSRNAILITESVMALKDKKEELESLWNEIKESNSQNMTRLKGMQINSYLEAGNGATKLIEDFERNKDWRERIIVVLNGAH